MPFKSRAQQRYFLAHRKELEKQGVSVDEWQRETGDKRLPERLGKTRDQKSKDKLKRAMKS